MAAPQGTARQWHQASGCLLVQGWGMCETCAIGTNNPLTALERSGTTGLPLPGDRPGDQGLRGQLACPGAGRRDRIRGPDMMQGYDQQPLGNERTFTTDGFMRTGDVAPWTSEATRASSSEKRT
ncbi:hypothetical protein [Ramlibacter sp.]|uniref:hypothetical protein n=1 Tax=Ramlibacter sp. TaxID=1917967 RepID=UPI00345CF18F